MVIAESLSSYFAQEGTQDKILKIIGLGKRDFIKLPKIVNKNPVY